MRFIAPKRARFFGAALITILCLFTISSISTASKFSGSDKHDPPETKVTVKKIPDPVVIPVPVPDPDTSKASSFSKLVVKNLGPNINTKSDDFGPTVTADGRTMYFVSDRKGGKGNHDFYVTHSPENDDTTWFAPVNLEEINTDRADGAASIAADGQTIYFATERNTTVKGDVNIWVATLEGKDWKNIHEIGAPINTTKFESMPSISPDGKKLFFASNREPSLGGVDIFVSHQLADGRWTEPTNLGSKINTSKYDASPFLAADGTTLYFCSAGHGGQGKLDIFYSEFKGPSDTDWTDPIALPPPINSPANDFFLTIPASGNVLFFTSDRDGGYGSYDIYVAMNPPKPRPTLVLRGVCYDSTTKDKLGAKVVIVDEQTRDTVYYKEANSSSGEYLCVLSANEKGQVGGSYLVSATYKDYFPYPPTRVNIPLRDDTSRIVTHDIPLYNEEPPIVKWVTIEPELVKKYPKKYAGFKGLIVQEVKTVDLFAQLPMIFYDQGIGTFAPRYVLFSSPAQTQGFTEDTITSTLNGYYNYLNILGYRMRSHPNTKITIVGCNSQEAANEQSIDLSRQRAEGVKKYLVEIWGIDPNRMGIEARKLPEGSTLSTTPEGIQENRRVQIKAEDWELIKPIKREQIIRQPDWRTSMLSMKNGLKNDQIAKRQIVISHKGEVWATLNELGDVTTTQTPEWNWRSDATHKLPDDESDLTAELLITDKNGRVVKSRPDATGVRQFTQQQVTAEHLAEKTRETYNLILFDYNSFNMGKWNHKILEDYVFERIKPNSDVQVNGYTDILGTPDYNLKLSENRANATKKDIDARIKGKVKSIVSKGYGKTQPLFPNELPEGRYYNRTVQVLIETPVNAD